MSCGLVVQMMFRFRLVRIAHLLLQGVKSLGGVVPESLNRPGTSFIHALRTMCCLLFPVFYSCSSHAQGDPEHGAWNSCFLLSRLMRLLFLPAVRLPSL